MPQIHDIGNSHYVHQMDYPSRKFPIIDKGNTQEIEWPYRVGNALVFRVPFTTKAFVLGHWVSRKDEEDALTSAIGAREVGPYVE